MDALCLEVFGLSLGGLGNEEGLDLLKKKRGLLVRRDDHPFALIACSSSSFPIHRNLFLRAKPSVAIDHTVRDSHHHD